MLRVLPRTLGLGSAPARRTAFLEYSQKVPLVYLLAQLLPLPRHLPRRLPPHTLARLILLVDQFPVQLKRT